jgi:hypothetical protein
MSTAFEACGKPGASTGLQSGQSLETNVAYRLFIAAGKAKGQHDFEVGGNR